MPQTATVQNTAIVILAAGKGKRMRSAVPKVLHEIAGRPMLGHVLAASLEVGATRLCLVTAPGQQEVRDYALTQVPEISNCIQEDGSIAHCSDDYSEVEWPYWPDCQR